MAEVREQFETNVYGLVRLSRLVLPGMRAHGGGTIVNIPSIFGRYAVPGSGFYNATKHAVEALSDALRNEVADFGVRVVWSSQDRCAPPASAPPTWPICGR
nr:SDR family NAD(P)-dependent oxidoreductase [Streptomyces sp. SPMA113]